MDYALLPDEELIKLLKKSDEDALKIIYIRHWQKLFTTAYAKTKSKEIAEEIVQAAFIKIWEKREESNIQNLESYLYITVKNGVINFFKSKLLTRTSPEVDDTHEIYDNTTQYSIAANDLSAALYKGIELLPEKTREVFTLSRLQHCAVKEIAQNLNLSEKAVEYHITKSVKLMRIYLKDFLVYSFIITHFR